MRFFLLSLFALLLSAATAQKKPDYRMTDAIVAGIPDSAETSVAALSGFFISHFPAERDRVRAIYTWTASEISYDIDNMYRMAADPNTGVTIMRTLETRKAVCEGYAVLFRELCANTGIWARVVHGYTKQNGELAPISHAWVVAVIDSGWYLFDPTWGGGFLMKGKYVKQFSNEYFMVKPAGMAKSHMPFDPMWQCLTRPLTPREFLQGSYIPGGDTTRFAFADSIAAYETLATADQDRAVLRRIEKAGITNNMTYDYARYLQQRIESDRINRQNAENAASVDLYNRAIGHYNQSVTLFNTYIKYYNNQFKPARPDWEIQQMVDTVASELNASHRLLGETTPVDASMRQTMIQVSQVIGEMRKQVEEQQRFLTVYFGTAKISRPGLFRKYTFLGIPVN